MLDGCMSILTFIIENGLIPQLLLLLGVWGTVIYLTLTHQDVPSWLQDAALAVLGYFFHVVQGVSQPPGK